MPENREGRERKTMHTILMMVRRVTIFLLAATLFTNLFSDYEYRKYFNYATGLIVIALVLAPVLAVFGKGNVMGELLGQAVFNQKTEQAEEEIRMLGEQYAESVQTRYEEQIRQDVAVQCGTEKENCKIRMSENRIEQISVYLEEEPENVTALIQSMAVRYGMDKDNIYVISDKSN